MGAQEQSEKLLARSYRGKRSLDLLLGVPLSLVAIPLLLACAAVSAVSFRAWPFFTQEREGFEGRPFRLIKVRSLPTSVPSDLDRDELDVFPTSRWGAFIRGRHLDELPQILQVVTGTMSLIGPRPMIASICDRMEPEFRDLRRSGRPGVTGLWQISEDGTRLVIEAMHHDERYLTRATLRLDVRILLETVRQVLGARRLTEAELLERFPIGPTGDSAGNRVDSSAPCDADQSDADQSDDDRQWIEDRIA
jgi:lipopolysaccharide/colanic/teichoic acid biosynthesis glycosyltransferase